MPKPLNEAISVKEAKDIAFEYNYPQVLIFAVDPETGRQHLTTYGKGEKNAEKAKQAGEYLKDAMGWVPKKAPSEEEKEK